MTPFISASAMLPAPMKPIFLVILCTLSAMAVFVNKSYRGHAAAVISAFLRNNTLCACGSSFSY
jgi:hypothetical protein